jgi:hypothetical protein
MNKCPAKMLEMKEKKGSKHVITTPIARSPAASGQSRKKEPGGEKNCYHAKLDPSKPATPNYYP